MLAGADLTESRRKARTRTAGWGEYARAVVLSLFHRVIHWIRVLIRRTPGMQNRIDSVALALQEICETKALLQSLIVSSERFDYFKAKHCLSELQKKVEALAEIEAQLSK